MQRNQLINYIIDHIGVPNPRYLEIGVLYGATFNSVNTCNKDGVDTEFFAYSEYVNYKMNSDTFFAQNPDKQYDIIFIDGLHTAYQTTVDLYNSIRAVSKSGGYILVGAVYPKSAAEQRAYNIHAEGPNAGDVWKAIYRVIDELDMICEKIVLVADIEAGGMVFKVKRGNTLNITIDPTIPTMNMFGTWPGPEKEWNKYTYQDHFLKYMKRIYQYFPDRSVQPADWF